MSDMGRVGDKLGPVAAEATVQSGHGLGSNTLDQEAHGMGCHSPHSSPSDFGGPLGGSGTG